MLDANKNKGTLEPYLGNSNVRWGQFDLADLAQMKFESHEAERYGIRDGDLIVCEGGEPGRCAIWREQIPDMKIQKALHRVRPKDGLNNYYLFYWLMLAGRTGHLEPYFTGTTIKHLTGRALAELEVPLPPIGVQEAIAHILGSLDDKIELNRQMNATLEEMARAVFKDWFVDFGPVRAKMEGREPYLPVELWGLFPDRFVESELGEIPEGWEVGTIGDIGEITIGGDWGKDTQENEQYIQTVSLRGVDLEHLRTTGDCPKAPIRWVKESSVKKRMLSNCDILIGGSGAGPCGRPLYVMKLTHELVCFPIIYSNFVKRIRCKSSHLAIFLDELIWRMFESNEISSYINGTSVPNLNDKSLLNHSIIIPDSTILEKFASLSEIRFACLYSRQSRTLATLRDSLLPRLVSGQLRVESPEDAVA
jgi:type I restriction enzyme S subunit